MRRLSNRHLPDNLPRPEHWADHAACVDSDPAIFQSEESRGLAKQVCGGCVVRDECLADAMARQEPTGVWGGLDEDQRRDLNARGAGAA